MRGRVAMVTGGTVLVVDETGAVVDVLEPSVVDVVVVLSVGTVDVVTGRVVVVGIVVVVGVSVVVVDDGAVVGGVDVVVVSSGWLVHVAVTL